MPEFDISGWKKARNRKSQEQEVRRKKLLAETREKVRRYFISHPGITEVYLTGSLLQPHRFHRYSDVDIVVEGLPETDYFRTKANLERLLNISVDLIELENCPFKKMIIDNGLKII